jgi:hypothetical protein
MAVAEGRLGKVTVYLATDATSSVAPQTVAELGEWSISGISRNMIDYTAFGDTVAKHKPGMLDPGTVTFSGFFDRTDSTGQVQLITSLTSGGAISNSTTRVLKHLRLWANDDTTFDGYGYFSCTGSSGEVYITSMETGTNKDGICTITFTGKVTKGAMEWSTVHNT